MASPNRALETDQSRMQALAMRLAPGEGMHSTALPTVKVSRSERDCARRPVLYEPSIYVIVSGSKRGYVGGRCLVYDESNYLVLSVPLPFECEIRAGASAPLLGVSVGLDIGLIRELAASMNLTPAGTDFEADCFMQATAIDAGMSSAVLRLLECLQAPLEAQVLGPGTIREIAYRVLRGPRAGALLAVLRTTGPLAQIHAALNRIHARYTEPLNVARLAEESGMSISAFHHNFKAVTASSPLQYVKSVRLHKARLLLRHDRVGAAIAANRVGYESASQFSREFKRMFGISPAQELRDL